MKEKNAGRIFKKMARHCFEGSFPALGGTKRWNRLEREQACSRSQLSRKSLFFYFTWRKLYLHMIG